MNQNGLVGQVDARAIEANLPPTTSPKVPLTVTLALAPEDQVHGHVAEHNSGGITRQSSVTILGHTTPGSLVFTDNSSIADFKFTGPFFFADTSGNFAIHQTLGPGHSLTSTEYLIVDPFGHHLTRAFPILHI